MLKCVIVALSLLTVNVGRGDTLRLTSGRDVDCVVLEETPEHFTVRRGYGVMDIPKGMVVKATRTPVVVAKPSGPATAPTASAVTNGSAHRFPSWSNVVDAVTRQPWGKGLRQIPATYIDNGVEKDVPYQSFAVGDYEINIYGDPDDPACIEIGVYRALLTNEQAKAGCVELIAGLLPNATDAAIARVMSRQKDLVTRDSFTVEITPPDAPDAYGGWWISIYDETKLDAARATPAEIESLTLATPATAPPTPVPSPPRPSAPTAKAPPPPAPPAVAAITGDDSDSDWTPADMQRRRVRASASTGTVGGRVYVRGYYRKNGTYVTPHSRRK